MISIRPETIRQTLHKVGDYFKGFFSVNDPGWGNNYQAPKGDKDPKEGGDQAQPNDPIGQSQGNRRPNSGPPDLDDLWRDFNDKLNNLFGGKKRPSGGGQPPSGGGRKPPQFNVEGFNPKTASLGALVIVTLVWLFSGFFMIQEGQAGVVLTFGKYDYTARPGINWRMPWPIQSTETVNLSAVRSVEIGRSVMIKGTNQKDSSMLTEDENIIDVRFAVQYRLKDPMEYLFNNRDPDMAVVQAAETAVREIVGRSKMDTVLYEGREKIAIDLALAIQTILDSYKTGIFVTSVTVQNVQPPEQVQAAFDDAVKASQDRERLKSEGEAYANDILPRAKGTAARLIQEAEGYRARVSAMAEGDALRFKQIYSEYAKAPQVTRDRMYIDTMKEIYNNVSKVLVDTTKSNSLLYLPLDKIINQVTTEAQQAAQVQGATLPGVVSPNAISAPAPNASPSPAERAPERREGLRSRER
ncbi:FtsH protease activity modulator HflK [Polynucleobacter sp. HIN10]|nr:FtsH protease activity modulator HflK [Polynucleobacter sp. HIN10]BEI44616.1 FtsH protease activity modulator HflK [Polynucleobacter sp. HIN11]